MRIPLVITVLILVAALCWGGYDRQRLERLRAANADLVAQAAARGILVDPDDPAGVPRPSKRPRLDRAAEAREVAISFMAYGKEMEAYQNERMAAKEHVDFSRDAIRHRMMDELDRVLALDGEQLKILMEEIRGSADIDDETRENLLRFALNRLTKDYPRDALAILTETPGMLGLMSRTNGSAEGAISGALRSWAKLDPQAALKWTREKAGMLSSDLCDHASSGLILGVADRDVRLALELIDEFGKDPSSFVNAVLVRDGQTPAQRSESLAAYREWKSSPNAARTSEQVRDGILSDLTFGRAPYRNTFEDVTAWVDESSFTADELELLCKSLTGNVKRAETGRWLVWLDTKLPPGSARRRAWQLFNDWLERDPELAREWVTRAAPDTPAKHTATRAYAEALFPDQPEEAIRLALSVPPDEYRQITLERLYARWPKDDEASLQAAEAFAKENGLLK